MIEEQAVVVGIEHDTALLEIVRNKPCGLCGQTRGCGVSVLGRLLGHRSAIVRAENQINAKTGDTVVVGLDEKALLTGSLAAYGVPLFSLLIGAALGASFATTRASADMYALAGAVAGLALGLLWLRAHSARRASGRYRPVVLRPATLNSELRFCKQGNVE
ncbi:MAG: SoxR reducing system RseC family protein [Methylobacillus sp.]|jgi:sigma-E factor negative regulatory protein RseC|nr:SoxR reducing system RseC family protein [Methylobacillus sp.]